MLDEMMLKNYKLSLQQKYNAVCFDIDGTLTEVKSKKIDSRAIKMIADLLKQKVPVVFITGRGETGLIDLKSDIFDKLKDNYNISDAEFCRMYVLTNDGARLFFTNREDKSDILKNSVYISSKQALNELKEFNVNIIEILGQKSLNNICNITYSMDSKTNDIINIRMVFENKNDQLIDMIFDMIDDILSKNQFSNICITRGIYEDKMVIQVGVAKKDLAIDKAERIIGVPKNSMIRIGDCGDIRGNDYSMLNCEQGYSVDKISGSLNSCFPVINNKGEILRGVEATLYLIKHAKILPTICLESANKNDYIYNYANIEKKIIFGKDNHIEYFNKIINENFNIIYGIDDLFDKFSGSVKIPMFEWELIKDNPLKKFWSNKDDDKLLYTIRDDNNYLLRGSSTYYYFLANRESNSGNDITTKENVLKWYCNYLNFFKDAFFAVDSTDDINSIENKKMILGLMDNIRNVLLVIINHKLYSNYSNKSVLLNLESDQCSELYSLLLLVEKEMANLCFSGNYNLSKLKVLNLLDMIYKNMYSEYLIINNNLLDQDYSKEYRAYREIDNFAENYITIALNNDKNQQIKNFGVCGLSYGGTELPILYKVINENIKEVLILKFSKQVSGYTNKQLIDLRKFNINEHGGLLGSDLILNKEMLLLDDNVLTGKTLQLAINSLYDCNFNVKNVSVVRYPGVNRVDQMFIEGHTAVDYNLFFDYITGLCFNSPYSWRDENDLNLYEDSLGVFDLNRKKIIECLIKNHDYNELSEVAEYKRRILK